MHLLLCIGFLESRDGPFLGLRDFVGAQLLPRHPAAAVDYFHWRDDVSAALRAAAATGKKPLILLGHSYGGSALVRAAAKTPDVSIDHLILLDPVPRWLWGQFQLTSYRLSPNIKAATCLYNPWSLPKSSPIRGGIARFQNIHVSPLHASIPGDPAVQSQVLAIIEQEFSASAPRVTPPPHRNTPPPHRVQP
jgi:pimeloyl-ACP methyl ester carboxylesterase